ITEGSSSNIFMVKEHCIYTHPASNLILNGITRSKVLELAKKMDMCIMEQPFTVKELLSADEAFITSTISEIIPVIKIDNHLINKGFPGYITQNLQLKYNSYINKLSS